jgi:hypothetical protein
LRERLTRLYTDFHYARHPYGLYIVDDTEGKRPEFYDEPSPQILEFNDITTLSISTHAEDIVIKRGGDSVKLEYTEYFNGQYLVNAENGLLQFKFNEEYVSSEHNSNQLFRMAFFRPADGQLYGEWAITITVPDDVTLKHINASTVGGDINIDGITAGGSVNAYTLDGVTSVTGCETGSMKIYGVTTASNVTECKIGEELIVNFVDGQAVVTDCIFKSLDINNINGSAKVYLTDKAEGYDISLDLIRNNSFSLYYNNDRDLIANDSLRQRAADKSISFSALNGLLYIFDN